MGSGNTEAERQEYIQQLLVASAQVRVSSLSEELDVSTVTIRKDLQALERRGLLRRVHGGAVATTATDEGSWLYRSGRERTSKTAIARQASWRVKDGTSVFLDSSTSSYYVGKELLDRRDLVVVTNGLPVAQLFLDRTTASVYLIGGIIRGSSRAAHSPPDSISFVGTIDIGFFGAYAAAPATGLCELSVVEAETKRAMAEHCNVVVAVLDSTKFSAPAFNPWFPARELAAVYTDDRVSTETRRAWHQLHVPLEVVSAGRSVA